jgi:[ribosomal protein S5]-alanine N-acetyltransferase
MESSIESPRLSLVSMGVPVLEAMLAEDLVAAAGLLRCHIPPDLLLTHIPAARRLRQMYEDPTVQPWLLRAMINRTSGTMVGHIGFHSPPRPEDLAGVAPDGIELGYTVYESFRRQKYATEAAIALMHWAYTQHDQRCFVLSVSPQNVASTAMAEALGFVRCGSHIDEEDGLEIIFVRRFEKWPGDWRVGGVE